MAGALTPRGEGAVATGVVTSTSPRLTVTRSEALFVSGEGGYHTFRIPALTALPDGAILAFAEGRRLGVSDTGLIEIVMRRSVDGGRTFGPLEVIVREAETTCGNPTPTFDPVTGALWLPFCKNPRSGPEPMIFEGKAPRTAWLTRSDDGGRTWTEPQDVSSSVKPPNTSWFAFGPGRGLALRSGRLIVPSVHAAIVDLRHSDPCRAHVTVSDDHGVTWRPTGVIDVPTSSENEIVEFADGELYLNARYEAEGAGRISAWSSDGGDTWREVAVDAAQTDATCQGSIALTADGTERVVLVNALGPRRRRLALRVSEDRGRTFSAPALLDEGRAAYSDVIALKNGDLLCLYERGVETPYEQLALVTFRLA